MLTRLIKVRSVFIKHDLNTPYGDMPPCLRRKQTSSVAGSQQLQSKSNISDLRNKKSVTNKDSKVNASSKVPNTRSATLSKNTVAEEVGTSTETVKPVTKKEDQTIIKRKNLRKGTDQEVPAKTKNVATHNVSNTRKNQTKSITKKISKKVNKNDSTLRQVSLKESFLNQSKIKRLRPRRIVKNYQDDDSLIGKHLSSGKRSSIVLLKELKTMPIYKYVSPETSVKNTSEIYEFKFDSNDSKERLPKKRKKKRTVVKKTVSRKKKTIPEKRDTQKSEVKEKLTNVEFEVIHKKNPTEPLKEQVCVEPLIKNPVKDDSDKCAKNNVALNKEQSSLLTSTNAEKTTSNKITKPTIRLIECLPNKSITLMDNSQISNSDEFKPFRPTNVFNNKFMVQHKNMLNNSLFDKSLSPIKKSSENFDLNSPWRAPPSLLTFSQVKNVFQSTPQNNKYEIYSNRFHRAINKESKSCENITTAKDSLLKNDENVSMEGYVNTNNIKRKHPSISRKFGTEITNVDHSAQSHLGDEINERVISDIENIQPSVQSINVINTNNTEDKENSTLNYQKPKKVLKKMRKNQTLSPQKSRSAESYEQKENLDPQPGPSGLQKNVLFNAQTILKQSNLNNFLNIMEKPQQIEIETPHGIFNDAPSTPISSKSIRKHNKPNMDLRNAFGFNDDNSNQDISFTDHDKENAKDIEKRDVKPFVKISIKEIKNNFLPKKTRKTVRSKKNVENIETELKKSPAKVKQNHIPIDITNFSDTFDVLSELDETSTENKSNVPLFMDLEPSHFTQPPKHSYKRKRNVKFSFSDENDEEEDEKLPKYEVKRKKVNNMKEKDDKNIIKWIEDINKTFAEVDEHELVVE